MDERLLEQIGLTKGEIKVYLTLLKLGESTTGNIIQEAQISSGKIYEILDKLIKKGLVSYILKDRTKYFTASSPNRILDYLNEKERQLKSQEEELQKQLPSLLSIQKAAKKQYETKLFRGFKGFETAIFEALDNLKQTDEVLAMGVISTKALQYNLLWQKWHRERIKKHIKCKVIFSETKSEYYKKILKMSLTETRVLTGITPTAIDIIGNNILILTHGEEPSCLLIKNSEISESFRTFFYNLWGIAKP